MDDSLPSRIFTKLSVAILAIALLDLAFVNWVIIKDQKAQNTKTQESSRDKPADDSFPNQESSLNPSSSPQAQPKEVGALEANPPAGGQTSNQSGSGQASTQTIIQTAQKEIFIPMGSGSTSSNTFADLAGAEVTIDTNKYSSIDSVVFEASIWVEGGNGKATARIMNVDDKNPFIESEILTTLGTATVKTSGKIPLPSATTKVYRVQAKTDITNFAAHVDNARLKITLK